MQSCCRFFLNNPKQYGFLELIIKHNIIGETKRKPLFGLCKTRWAERQDAYQHFYQAYIFITESLELIGYKQHLDKYGGTFWDTSSRSDAQQTLASITTFEFITIFLTIYQYLSHLAGIAVKLQKHALDIVEVYEQIKEVSKTFKDEQRNIDLALVKYMIMPLELQKKLVLQLKSHALLQGNVAISFLDHIVAFIDQHFSQSSINSRLLLCLVPSVLCSKDLDLQAAVSMYNKDIPSPELFEMELR